ncbi:hypothetical protein FRAHR75_2780001 [Frankia sp. Hr75.2]|nr:hypothetical protein FRAHR75_2780001 [Frankia sp. Hr75.2]
MIRVLACMDMPLPRERNKNRRQHNRLILIETT